MFVLTPEGVSATDPISLARPQVAHTYIEGIRKITSASTRYVVYSHHRDDHIAGGEPFKKLGAVRVVAHQRKAR